MRVRQTMVSRPRRSSRSASVRSPSRYGHSPPSRRQHEETHHLTDSPSQTKNEPNKKAKADKPSTAIYVTSIPLDATLEEIHQVFSRCGMIAEEIDSDGPRIKMYKDDEGNFKGDALIIFFRPESINQAMILLDESDFRPGVKGPDGPMRISIADDSYKKTKQEGGGGGDKAGGGSGTSTPMRRGRKGDKQKIIEKTARLNQRLADWSDDEDGGALLNREIKKEVRKTNRFDKIVVLKHMFTPEGLAEELKEDPEVKEFLLEDVKEKCEEVTGAQVLDLFLFDLEEEGVMTVRFADAEAAEKCVNSLHGFVFDGRKVDASISTGQKFRKSEADEEEERKRLDAFAESLENAPDT